MDFLGCWFIERTSGGAAMPSLSPKPDSAGCSGDFVRSLIGELSSFISWCRDAEGLEPESECRRVLEELQVTLPRAIEINRALAVSQSNRTGAFEFHELLSSFEEGGRTHYDLDVAGASVTDEVHGLEGFFCITGIAGHLVEAREMISERQVGSIAFPPGVAELLAVGYTINLELIKRVDHWEITGCGLAYPPGALTVD
jgi:hypothetical protein